MVLQVRTVVEPKDLGGRLSALLQKDTDDVDRQRVDLQRALDRLAQLFRRMVFQEPQDLDELASPFAAGLRFKPTSQDREAIRQLPLLERLAEVERVWLTLKQHEIMERFVKQNLLQ